MRTKRKLRFIDLFSGIGGIRRGFELACEERGIDTECVLTAEIKTAAVKVFHQNHPGEELCGDVKKLDATAIPDFDVLLAGFPCQAFSTAGKRQGFADTRGTLFFEVERILAAKQPAAFILENVEGLVIHDRARRTDAMGRTLTVILTRLKDLGYQVTWKVLNAKDFGVPQDRRRVYIVGTRDAAPSLSDFAPTHAVLGDVLEHGLPTSDSPFVRHLLSYYTVDELIGKSIKDKRGGKDNIHSWDIEYHGETSAEQKQLMNEVLHQRRKHQWAEQYGVTWMDGMPLTLDMIRAFHPAENLEELLDDLVEKGYLKKEHPKELVNGNRVENARLPLGYNIIAGKLSFEVSEVLDPAGVTPTLVAMDMSHLFVPDGKGIRRLTMREGLRLFGYPDDTKFEVSDKEGYDLLGNTVVVPVIRAVASRALDCLP